jgi:hypothetical protein
MRRPCLASVPDINGGSDYDFPASMRFISPIARCDDAIAPLVVDTGPLESVFAKKMRSIGWRAAGISLV